MPRDYFSSVSHFDFGVHQAADHPVTVAVERQARGGFRFHTFRASVVVDGAARPHDVMRECAPPEHPSPFWVRIRIIYKLVLSAHELLTLPGSTR
jgi:hypothetical protein